MKQSDKFKKELIVKVKYTSKIFGGLSQHSYTIIHQNFHFDTRKKEIQIIV